jgi:hypothetical protein
MRPLRRSISQPNSSVSRLLKCFRAAVRIASSRSRMRRSRSMFRSRAIESRMRSVSAFMGRSLGRLGLSGCRTLVVRTDARREKHASHANPPRGTRGPSPPTACSELQAAARGRSPQGAILRCRSRAVVDGRVPPSPIMDARGVMGGGVERRRRGRRRCDARGDWCKSRSWHRNQRERTGNDGLRPRSERTPVRRGRSTV